MKKERFGVAQEVTPEQVDEVRQMVDKLIVEGKVYRDDEGRVWPVKTNMGRT